MYQKNFLRIYFWKLIAVITGFLSLIIVVPHLSSDAEIYGIYMFVVSISLYLNYADLGFISAGQKYAAEYFAINNKNDEVGMIGFTIAVLILMFIPFSLSIFYLHLNPGLAFNEIGEDNLNSASDLFLILSIIFPVQIILQRLIIMILSIRLLDYVIVRIDIIANIIKISSVLYFFRDGQYNIVAYFLFCTLISILGNVIAAVIVKNSLDYNFRLILKSLTLSKKYFLKSKDLALASFSSTIGFVLFYELDLILIGKFIGVTEIAIFAVAFTFMNFIRSLWVIVYSPILNRLNHFKGLNMMSEIKNLIRITINFTTPLYLVITVALILFSNEIILYWVGKQYLDSIPIMQMLILSIIFGSISQPAMQYFITCSRYSYIYISSIIVPFIFYLTIYFTYENYGILAFAVAKFMASFIFVVISLKGLFEIINPFKILKTWLIPSIIFSLTSIGIAPHIKNYFFINPDKNSFSLLILLIFLAFFILSSYLLLIFLFKKNRLQIINFINKINKTY